jgi:hypothetical protein
VLLEWSYSSASIHGIRGNRFSHIMATAVLSIVVSATTEDLAFQEDLAFARYRLSIR